MQLVPILIGRSDLSIRMGFEMGGRFCIVVEIELAIYNFECLGVHSGNLAGGCKIARSVTSILRRISFWVLDEQVPVGFADKIPFRVVPFVGDFATAFHCSSFCMISDSIEAFDSDAKEGAVHLTSSVGGGGPKHQNGTTEQHHESPIECG